MSVRKILIDFSEYKRLLQIEKYYEELLKKEKEGKEGKGDLSLTLVDKANRDALEAPLAKELGSITVPPNAQYESENEEPLSKSRRDREKFIFDKWYELGPPL